jgi:hypothetical protein
MPNRLVGSDGRVFNVNFALARRSPVANLGEQMRVAVDPDDHPMDDSGNFMVHFLDGEGRLASEKVSIEEYNQKTPWPLLLVNTFEEVPETNSLPKTGSENSTDEINSGYYLSVRAIDLGTEHDGAGYEEFELYVREDVVLADVVDCGYLVTAALNVGQTTSRLFNDGTRADAMGRSRKFPDINVDEGGWITMPGGDIALVPLDYAEKRGIVGFEDDTHVGIHVQTQNVPSCGGYVLWQRNQTINSYRWDLGRNHTDVVKFSAHHPELFEGSDDFYGYSGIFGVTSTNGLPMLDTEHVFTNKDFWMKMLVEN